MKATTPKGLLNDINNCYLFIPQYGTIVLNNLPEVSDSKSAVFNSESIIGRSSPLHTYSYSDTRTISVKFHFYVIQSGDIIRNLDDLRAIQSCVYPQQGTGGLPFKPPAICKLRVGNLLANEQDICVVLQQYSVDYPPDVAWDEESLCPYKFDVNTTWMVVYSSDDLPFSNNIIVSGR